MLLDETDDILINILCLRPHLIIEVRTVKRTLEFLRIQDAQILLDIRAHLVGSRRCQSDDRRLADLIHDRTDTTVLGTEVMSPLRDTVGFINGIERNLHRLEEVHILLFRKRLRRHIEQFGDTRLDIRLHLVNGTLVER